MIFRIWKKLRYTHVIIALLFLHNFRQQIHMSGGIQTTGRCRFFEGPIDSRRKMLFSSRKISSNDRNKSHGKSESLDKLKGYLLFCYRWLPTPEEMGCFISRGLLVRHGVMVCFLLFATESSTTKRIN